MIDDSKLDIATVDAIWPSFARALDAELRPDKVIRGSSGLEHPVQAIAVDEKTNRLLIVSPEPNPRVAAMMQADVQASLPESHVLVARSIAIDLVGSVGKIARILGLSEVDISHARLWLNDAKTREQASERLTVTPEIEKSIQGVFGPALGMDIPALPLIMNLVSQAEKLPWQDIGKVFGETTASGTLDLGKLIAVDNLSADLAVGVCPLPLYEFLESDIDLMISGKHVDEVRQRLHDLQIYQYFFPPADQVALGIVDRGIQTAERVLEVASTAPLLGHPFGRSELIPTATQMVDLINKLKESGYVAEGEHGVEISKDGSTVRSLLKFKPREGFLTKLLNRCSFSASVSTGDFLP